MIYRFRPTHAVARCSRRIFSYKDSFEICLRHPRCSTASQALTRLIDGGSWLWRWQLERGTVLFESSNAVVLGLDDKHLSRRWVLSVRPEGPGARTLRLETAVLCRDWIGQTWLAVFGPLHRQLVRTALHRLSRD
ncbi:MAG TPA: DUF2867 domain-containing protein [Polyangiaceae bacterium]